MGEADFSKLLQAAEQMTTDAEGDDEMPRVERSLGQVLEAAQELYSRVMQSGANDIQAHLLLGSKGIDLQQISSRLETLSSKRTLEPLQPIADSDVESFLRNERENAVLCLYEEVNKNSMQTIEDQKWEHMLSEWNREKMKLMNAMIGPSQNWLDLKRSAESPGVAEAPRRLGHSMLGDAEAAYARQLMQHNKTLLQGAKPRTTLCQRFAQAAEEFNDPKVKEMWEMVRVMSSVPVLPRDEDPIRARSAPDMQAALIAQGNSYLENRYKQYMRDVVSGSGAGGARGGEPGTLPLVRAFVGLRAGGALGLADGCVDERPLWPMLYYCLRSGDPHAALHCLRKAGRDHEEFASALEEYARSPERTLSDKTQTSINLQYRIQVRNSTDPYKRAVWCVVGGCEPSEEHAEVARTADDYLWLKLSVVKPRATQTDSGALSYSDLQKMILEEYGEVHYKAYEKPLVYFQVLTLSGQFEPAIEFLSRIPRYQVHGVHMAIALHDMALLATPRNVQAPLLSVDIEEPSPLRRLNVARLLLLYTRRFQLTDPAQALHYFYLLRSLRDPGGRNLFMCCCTDLAVESRDYDLLFGAPDPNTDERAPGLLHQFNGPNINETVIALNVAEELVNKGLFEDAITVYDIAGNVEKALELLCVLLSQVVSGGGGGGAGEALRTRLLALGSRLARRLDAGVSAPRPLLHAFSALRRLAEFFSQLERGEEDAALESLRACELVPLGAGEVEARVAAAGAARGELLRCLPAVLRALARLLTERRQRINTHQPTAHDAKQLEWLRQQAEVLNTFAGNISYRMPRDTYSQLAQMQILMH